MFFYKNKKQIFLLSIIFFLGSFGFASAFVDESSIAVKPKFPSPREEVVVSIEDYSQDVTWADILWYRNGVLEKRGLGERKFSFVAGDVGEVENIEVVGIDKNDKLFISGKITVIPGEVDLLWESDTYTPPFYKGKALPSFGSTVTFIALPNIIDESGIKVKNGNLLFRWELENKYQPSSSGVGKNKFVWERDSFQWLTTSVEVTTEDGATGAKGYESLDNVSPEVLLYEEDPLLGVLFNRALLDNFVLKDEAVFAGFPFAFSMQGFSQDSLLYEWEINDSKVEDNQSSRIVTRRNGEESGFSLLSLSIKDSKDIMQKAQGDLKIILNSDN